MSPSRRRLFFWRSSAYSSSSFEMTSARTSIVPSRSVVLRPADSARTTHPSAMAMWMTSSRASRWRIPLFACWPMSWRISAIPKSLSVPLSATRPPLLRPPERVAHREPPHRDPERHGERDLPGEDVRRRLRRGHHPAPEPEQERGEQHAEEEQRALHRRAVPQLPGAARDDGDRAGGVLHELRVPPH